MTPLNIVSYILSELQYEPTQGQTDCIHLINEFIQDDAKEKCFILKGYAGTGKTTLVGALVRSLPKIRYRTVLLAPTGRAAKVLSNYSGKKAFTIHKKIYQVASDGFGIQRISRAQNKHTNTIFIIDEASMIGEYTSSEVNLFGSRSLLDDLLSYVYEGKNCYAFFVGDTAQLPPVGTGYSPALDADFLEKNFTLSPFQFELTEVVRQVLESGILKNATSLRKKLNQTKNPSLPLFNVKGESDIVHITSYELEELLLSEYGKNGVEDVVVICRTNKRANIFNQQIRSRIFYLEGEISTGDYIMVVKNNYSWLDQDSEIGFIANGDIAEIQRIRKIESLYGFNFADVSLRFVDYPDHPNVECKLLLDTLTLPTPALDYETGKRFFEEIMKDYLDIPSKQERFQKIKENPYYNALQVKFSYTLTCHKTQGGQWKRVFLDAGWFIDEMLNQEYLQWLYTALTRATEKVYLLNFKGEFFREQVDS